MSEHTPEVPPVPHVPKMLEQNRPENFDSASSICRACVTASTRRRCDGCKEDKMTHEFQRNSIALAGNRGGFVVCKACQERGLSRTNIQIYRCEKKGCQYGHLKFVQTEARPRICRVCEGEDEAKKKMIRNEKKPLNKR